MYLVSYRDGTEPLNWVEDLKGFATWGAMAVFGLGIWKLVELAT